MRSNTYRPEKYITTFGPPITRERENLSTDGPLNEDIDIEVTPSTSTSSYTKPTLPVTYFSPSTKISTPPTTETNRSSASTSDVTSTPVVSITGNFFYY